MVKMEIVDRFGYIENNFFILTSKWHTFFRNTIRVQILTLLMLNTKCWHEMLFYANEGLRATHPRWYTQLYSDSIEYILSNSCYPDSRKIHIANSIFILSFHVGRLNIIHPHHHFWLILFLNSISFDAQSISLL